MAYHPASSIALVREDSPGWAQLAERVVVHPPLQWPGCRDSQDDSWAVDNGLVAGSAQWQKDNFTIQGKPLWSPSI